MQPTSTEESQQPAQAGPTEAYYVAIPQSGGSAPMQPMQPYYYYVAVPASSYWSQSSMQCNMVVPAACQAPAATSEEADLEAQAAELCAKAARLRAAAAQCEAAAACSSQAPSWSTGSKPQS